MQVRILSHPDCNEHQPGLGHPERPERIATILRALDGLPAPTDRTEVVLPSEDDTLGALRWIHDAEYIDRVRQACEEAPAHVDTADCSVGPQSWKSLVAAPGITLRAALDQANGKSPRAFVVARPPSHHAERNRAAGYCFFNSTALAAEVLTRASGGPVLIVDIDAHHGNGTQKHFWKRNDVAFLSIHQYPAFPGTGGADEIGEGPGHGLTRNVPLASGATDDTIATALECALEELGARIRPAAVVVSAGFSGHRDDPVSGFQMTEDGFRRLTRAITQAADTWSEGRILSILEGGYDLEALAASAAAHVEALAGPSTLN